MSRYALVPVVVALAAFFAVLPQTGADAEVTIAGVPNRFSYQPSTVRVDPGERVAFTNDTRRTHTATCTQPGCWDSGDIQPGETVFVTMEEEGSYGFVCRYHSRVSGFGGRVIVGDAEGQTTEPSPGPTATGSPATP